MKAIIILLALVCVVVLFGLGDDTDRAPVPPAAIHNSAHDCDLGLVDAIMAGLMGGQFFGADCRVTWTDGNSFLVCQNGQAVSMFRCRNAERYATNDAARHGAQRVSADTARDILGWHHSELVLAMAAACGLLLVWLLAQPKRTEI